MSIDVITISLIKAAIYLFGIIRDPNSWESHILIRRDFEVALSPSCEGVIWWWRSVSGHKILLFYITSQQSL